MRVSSQAEPTQVPSRHPSTAYGIRWRWQQCQQQCCPSGNLAHYSFRYLQLL